MNTWNLRVEILEAAHRWYWIVAGFLLGIFIGWLVSFIWPAPYRAIEDVYVGLNAYKSNRDLYVMEVAENDFRNRDDYKNWQMNQLDALAMSDEYLQETLNRLQTQDSYWQNLDVPALRGMLAVAWRNTGEWHFTALNAKAQHSAQAATTWSDVVIEKANISIAAAERLILLDSQRNALDQTLVGAKARQILLQNTQFVLDDWQTVLTGMPADEPLSPSDHWGLVAVVSVAADWTPGWVAILDEQPPFGALPTVYLDWLAPVNALIEAELAVLPTQIKNLQAEYDQVSTDYELAAVESRALSSGMEVAQIKEQPTEIVHLRPAGTLMLVGGFLGLLVFILVWLYQITRRTEQ